MIDHGTSAAGPLSPAELERINAYWRAANYLSVGQIYLLDNPLLREPLGPEHVKPRLLGHWGTTPGLNLIYAHLNRVIRNWDLDAIYIIGPGHGGPATVANAYLEGTYSEVYPSITRDADGMRKLFRQFSFPGGIPSHVAPETPGSIHEGGELGYALSHAYGAAFDNPDLLVCAVVGDGEAETGPLATSWHSNKFLDPVARRRRPADPPPQRLQDRQPDGARPHPPGRAAGPDGGLRPQAVLRRGRRPGPRPPADGGHPRHRDRGDPRHPARGPRGRRHRAAALADDRPADAQGLDRPQGDRRQAGRGHLALAPGPDGRGPRERREPGDPRGLAAQLPARGAVRRERRPGPRARRAAAQELPPDEREPARQRRPPPARPRPARLPRLRRGRPAARAPRPPRRPACWAPSCATSWPATWTPSGSSGPTRRPRTAWAPSWR